MINFTLEQFEFFLVILVRISGFIFSAPFFGIRNVPLRLKAGLSLALTVCVFYTLPYEPLEYNGIIGYSLIIIGELLAGLILGFLANVVYQILALAGQLLDLEIGFSMVNEMDPVTSAQVTVSGNLYSYAIMIIMMVTYMHHYILEAIIDSFTLIPVGNVSLNPMVYTVMASLMRDYFILAFRIILPVFSAMLIVNTVLAILAKVAPQMNMFVVGMQLKVLIGLAVMVVMITMIPGISNLIFDKMLEVMRSAIAFL